MSDPVIPSEALPVPKAVYDAAITAMESAAGDRLWAVIRAAYVGGVAAGRSRAADYLEQRGRVIREGASTVADIGLGSALFNVARELREAVLVDPPERPPAPDPMHCPECGADV